MKKLVLTFVSCFSLILLAACGGGGGGGDKLAELKEEGVVTVGFANEAPYAYKGENGELKGAAVEIAREVFKKMGIEKMEGKLSDWGELIPGLKTGKFDVITAGMAIKPDRCKQVDFAHPGIVYGEGMVVKKGNPMDLHSYKDIAKNSKVKVAVMSGATEVGFLKSAGVKESQIKTYPDIPATLAAVKTGRADATTATALTVKKAMKASGGGKLEFVKDFEQPDVEGVPSYGAAAFAQDADALRKAFNKELDKLKKDGKILDIIEPGLFGENNIIKKDITTEELCKG